MSLQWGKKGRSVARTDQVNVWTDFSRLISRDSVVPMHVFFILLVDGIPF